MIPHPIVKAGLEISSVGAIASYWFGLLPGFVAFIATAASAVYYILQAYYLYKEKNKG